MSKDSKFFKEKVDVEKIFEIYDTAKNKILLYVESSVSHEQFKALRKLILDELGNSGAEGKVREIFSHGYGQAGNESSKGGGVYEC